MLQAAEANCQLTGEQLDTAQMLLKADDGLETVDPQLVAETRGSWRPFCGAVLCRTIVVASQSHALRGSREQQLGGARIPYRRAEHPAPSSTSSSGCPRNSLIP
jgi:hypothetical protein